MSLSVESSSSASDGSVIELEHAIGASKISGRDDDIYSSKNITIEVSNELLTGIARSSLATTDKTYNNANSILNAKQPVMRLLPDALPLIIDRLACVWSPCVGDLGWITTAHVCVVWRRAVMSLASLWAREIGAFPSPESFYAILSHTGDAPLTLRNEMNERRDGVAEHHWHVLSQPYKLHTLDLRLRRDNVARLAHILRYRFNNDIKILFIDTLEDCSGFICPEVISLPSLHWLSLSGVYIPFSASNLLGLRLYGDTISNQSLSCAQFLDSLRSTPNLLLLELLNWAPVGVPFSLDRIVRLAHLQTLTVSGTAMPSVDICRCFDLPALEYLMLGSTDRPALATVLSTFDWLLLNEQIPPCIRDVFALTLDAEDWQDTDRNYHELLVCLDNGELESKKASSLIGSERSTSALENRRGIYIFSRYDGRISGKKFSLSSALFRDMIAGYLSLCGRVTVMAAIRSAHLDFRNLDVDWDGVLRRLVDVEYLHVFVDELFRLEPVLSKTGPGDTILLPRSKSIVWKTDDRECRSWEEEEEGEVFTKTINHTQEILGARAAHGISVVNMKAVREPVQESANEEVLDAFCKDFNAYFEELVP